MKLLLENIYHSYGQLQVLKDITLEIPDRKIVCFVGPSGCGKSTLLRIIGGLEKPISGNVFQVGSPPQDCINPFTYVFQDFALLPWRSVEFLGAVLKEIFHSYWKITEFAISKPRK